MGECFVQEQEKYITELENQNRVPEGKEVIHPSPGFVIKTKYARNAKDDRREKVGNMSAKEVSG